MNANITKHTLVITLILSVSAFVISIYFENHQKINYEKERNEFRLQWEDYNKQQTQEKEILYMKIRIACELNPNWNEFKEGYIREANKLGIDMNTQMFNEMIFRFGFPTFEHFIRLYFHYDSEERELLRKYKSIQVSRLDYNSYPYKLRNFESYKESLPDDLSFIHKNNPAENMAMIFFGGLIIMLVCIIIEVVKKKKATDLKNNLFYKNS